MSDRLRISFDDIPDDEPSQSVEDVDVVLRPVRRPRPMTTPVLSGDGAVVGDAGVTAGTAVAMASAPQPMFDVGGVRYAYATWLQRVGAALIDGLILTVGTLTAWIIFGLLVAATGSTVSGLLLFLFVIWLLVPLVQMAYAPTLMARAMPFNGQTFGKQLLGLRVCRIDHRPVYFWFGVLRNVVVIGFLFTGLGSLLFWIPLILDLLWPLWDDERRCLHDIMVRTVVIREP